MMEKFAIIAHTHWDREWYLPYRMFRAQLVAMLDRLLGLMARRPDFPPFMLDGQSILLKDYLAVRPEREGELRRLVSEGRLLVGPFYVHPDELLVGGESLIRNLLQGLALAHRFGLPMMVGYVADTFGHTPYLPAILRGFGIEAATWITQPTIRSVGMARESLPPGSRDSRRSLPLPNFSRSKNHHGTPFMAVRMEVFFPTKGAIRTATSPRFWAFTATMT